MGIAGLAEGGLRLGDRSGAIPENWIVAVLLIGTGMFLLMGFLTPLAGAVAALTTLAAEVSWFQPPRTDIFDGTIPAALLFTVATAVSLLGPGSFSLDRRIFGRREIIIPRAPYSSSQ